MLNQIRRVEACLPSALAAVLTGFLAVHSPCIAAEGAIPAYPVPGRQPGTTAFIEESSAQHLASSGYPAWFRGQSADGRADQFSQYFYTQLLGAAAGGTAGSGAQNIRVGTLVLRGGATYPAHHHPAREIYYVIEGEADWYVDDERHHVAPGSLIVHRPFAVHGWTNTSKDKPLKVLWIRWLEDGEKPALLDQPARMVNPDLAKKQSTAQPFAVPLPAVRR